MSATSLWREARDLQRQQVARRRRENREAGPLQHHGGLDVLSGGQVGGRVFVEPPIRKTELLAYGSAPRPGRVRDVA